MKISKELMNQETKNILQALFKLPELEKIQIKGVAITALEDECVINRAVDESYHDLYSDIDIEIYIKLNPEEYNSNAPIYSDCMERLGFQNNILGMSYYCAERRTEVIRVCKTNGIRLDLIIIASCADGIPVLPHKPRPKKEPKDTDEFWFVAIQALGKLMRRDYLIASHLAHMLVQDGLVLQMLIRDNEKKTNFHRYGYAEELKYLEVFNGSEYPFSKICDDTYNYIARLLYSAVKSFDNLYPYFDEFYKSRLDNYLEIWDCYCN